MGSPSRKDGAHDSTRVSRPTRNADHRAAHRPRSAEPTADEVFLALPDARQGRLIARRLDALELRLDAIERHRGVVVLVPGIAEVLADHVEDVAELVDVAAQPAEARLDLPCVLLDLQAPEPE